MGHPKRDDKVRVMSLVNPHTDTEKIVTILIKMIDIDPRHMSH